MKTNVQYEIQNEPTIVAPHTVAARGLGQALGIHPAMAFLTLIVDSMLFGGEIASLGMILPISCVAGAVLGLITWRVQVNWYGDDNESAWIKGLILGGLTALPTALPAMLYVPSGIVGLVQTMRRKS